MKQCLQRSRVCPLHSSVEGCGHGFGRWGFDGMKTEGRSSKISLFKQANVDLIKWLNFL